MTPEDTPRMAERTDRQPDQAWLARIRAGLEAHDRGDLNPNADMFAWESVAYLLPFAALLRERDAQIASLTAERDDAQAMLRIRMTEFMEGHCCHQCAGPLTATIGNDVRCAECDEGVESREAEIATLRAERDAAQQENAKRDASIALMDDLRQSNAALQAGLTAEQQRSRTCEQENQTLREALDNSDMEVELLEAYVEDLRAICEQSNIDPDAARAALSSSPRPQEPQP